MSDEYYRMVLVFPNANNSTLNYSYEISNNTDADDNILEITAADLKNYPNPFNPSTTISFETMNSLELARIEIYNLRGQKIKKYDVILSGVEGESNSIYWDGTNENNQPVSSGIYYYKLMVNNKVIDTRKMILMK
ncbi:MAG: T9SS type A sorting domain-containing protein [Candidatus Cloacimonetes bacterium]|jgi:flagellar hook assembly protein FlgD|nr:T9SS type A sorting domain-containing protein [Candidatus Cloacimonadota bacterium]